MEHVVEYEDYEQKWEYALVSEHCRYCSSRLHKVGVFHRRLDDRDPPV